MAKNKEAENKKEQAQVEEKNNQANGNGGQAEFDLNSEVEQLTQALNSDLSEIQTEDAIGLIDHWYDFLHQSKEPAAKEMAKGLKELQKLVKSDKATGHEISEELIALGEQLDEFSDAAEKGSKQSVQRLGKQLRKAGTAIAKEEDQEYLQQIDELVENTESDELTSIDPEAAVGQIDTWYNLLHKAEGESYEQLANSLKELKQALKRNNAKPETIAKALSAVGEQTTAVAGDLPRGFKGAVQKLGKRLTNTSKSLAETK